MLELGRAPRGPAAVAAEGERRPQNDWKAEAARDRLAPANDSRRGDLETCGPHRLAEELPVLGAADRREGRADQLDPELLEDARLRESHGEVERRLTAHRRQHCVRPLALEHVRDALEVERLEVRR